MDIEVKRSCIEVHDYSIGDSQQVENMFTVKDPVTLERHFKGASYDFNTRTLFLPRGIDVNMLEMILKTKAKYSTKADPITPIEKVYLKYPPKDRRQEQSLSFIVGVDGYERNREISQISINLNTGAGKTYVAIAAAAFLQLKTLIIPHTKDMMTQWKNEILAFTDVEENEICMISSGTFTMIRIMNGMINPNRYKFFIINHRAIQAYANTFGWLGVSEFFKEIGIGLKIFDEAHLFFDNLSKIDFATDTYKTIYLTATPKRSDKKENVIYQEYFRCIPSIELFDEEADPRTHYVAFHYSTLPTPVDVSSCEVRRRGYSKLTYFNASLYAKYAIHRPNFYTMLFILIEMAMKRGKTIFYIENNDSIDFIYRWIMNTFPELQGRVGILNSKVAEEIKEEQKQKDIILTTTKSCGTGVHIDHIALGVILAAPFSTETILRQMLGRMRDYNTTLIYCIDHGFSKIRSYYQSSLGMFARYALDITDVDLKGDKLNEAYQKVLMERTMRFEREYSHGISVFRRV